MKHLMRITELFLMILYIPIFIILFYIYVLKGQPNFYGIFFYSLYILPFINLYYLLLVLGKYKYSRIKSIIYVLLTLIFPTVFVEVFPIVTGVDRDSIYLPYTYLMQFCVSLLIVFLNYKKRGIKPDSKKVIIEKTNIPQAMRETEILLGMCYILILSYLFGLFLSRAGFNYSSVRGLTFLFGTISAINSIIFIPLFLLNLSYLLLTLSEYKHSRKKYIIFVALFLILNLVLYIHNIQSDRYFRAMWGRQIILFVISLSIAFFYYRRKRLESKN